MSFKVGDKVRIKTKGFTIGDRIIISYFNQTGVITVVEETHYTQKYIVQFDSNNLFSRYVFRDSDLILVNGLEEVLRQIDT